MLKISHIILPQKKEVYIIIKGNSWNLIETQGDSQDFRYLHGVEMEYFLLDGNFNPVSKNEKLKDLINEVYGIIKLKLKRNPVYEEKVLNIEIGTEEKLKYRDNKKDIDKIQTIFVEYGQPNYNDFISEPIDIIGKDTNIGTGNFITLELVTPPCANVKELTWWIDTLIFSTQTACRSLHLQFLMSAGHPNIDKNFCGEHHHIGAKNADQRMKIHNLMRIFLPYLSVLSYSHFQKPGNQEIDIKENIFETKVSNQFIRGWRLSQTSQIKPACPIFNMNRKDFADSMALDINTCRMVDLYPFTEYDTLEVRIFDTQISIARTIATVILLQAICELSFDIDGDFFHVLKFLLSKDHYTTLWREMVKKGLSSIKNPLLYQSKSLRSDLEFVCDLCIGDLDECDSEKLFKLNCEFRSKNLLNNNIISFLLFPKRFIYNEQDNIQLKRKYLASDSIKQLLYLLKPYLKKLSLAQSIPLKVIEKTINAGFEPSMYWMIQYKKNL